MDFAAIIDALMDQVSEIVHANPLLALAVVLILAYLIYRKPLLFLSVVVLGFILAGVLYLITSISSPGVSNKEKMIQKRSEPENSFRPPGILL